MCCALPGFAGKENLPLKACGLWCYFPSLYCPRQGVFLSFGRQILSHMRKTAFERSPIMVLAIGKKKRKSKMHLDQAIVLKDLTDIQGKQDSKASLT